MRIGSANIVAASYDIVPSRHGHAHVLVELVSNYHSVFACIHTTVMGILGAFGKMNLTSSNLPRLRQDSASETLMENQFP